MVHAELTENYFCILVVHPFLNSSDPESCGISNARNLYIQGEDGRLGVW